MIVVAMLPGMTLVAEEIFPGMTIEPVRRYTRPELLAKRVPAAKRWDCELYELKIVIDPVAFVSRFLPIAAGTVVLALPVTVIAS